jgi:uncharacterized protein YyaL (SSP411 family)
MWRRPAHDSKVAWVCVLGLAGAALGCAAAAEPTAAKASKDRPANRLARESSPYLLQHAHNPVDWYPWAPEAFDKAKKENKLVFLSIGYSSCHWCHVMERECFDNPDVAKLLNDWFVCIKVDREERPDIDAIYMTALNVQGQRGGWPLSMFLLADGKPIIGGTYWPPEDKEIQGEKVPGFKTILRAMHDAQTTKPERLVDRAGQVAAAARTEMANVARGVALIDLDRALLDAAVKDVMDEFDPEYGGFGARAKHFQGTKFPVPSYLELLLHEAACTKSAELNRMVTVTLDHMAQGGIYDQLGGGFHRYSTERTWTVPHFEKMLYDNAQLAEIYAKAFRQTQKPLYRRIVSETLDFVSRELTSPEGAFYSALDADSSGAEGLFYVWTDKDLASVLTDRDDLELFRKVYGADTGPNFEGTYHILVLAKPEGMARELGMTEEQLAQRLAPLRRKVFESRAGRSRPFLDTKILTGWNGQMIAGYATAGKELGERRFLEAAARAADFVLHNLRNSEGRLFRAYHGTPGKSGEAKINGYLDDYAYLAHGLLCLHDATGDNKWLEEAKALSDDMVKLYADPQGGGFFYTSSDHETLFARAKDQYDGAQPSGNSMAALNLLQLWQKTGQTRYRDLATRSLKAFAGSLKSNPTALTAMACALALYVDAQPQKPAAKEPAAQAGDVTKSDSKVKITTKAEPEKPGADGKQVVTLTIKIDPGWHLYANPVGSEDLTAAQTTLTVDSKVKPAELKIEYPSGKEIDDKVVGKYKVYEDKAVIKATITRAAGDTGPLELTLKFQACNERQCLLPATAKLKVPAE